MELLKIDIFFRIISAGWAIFFFMLAYFDLFRLFPGLESNILESQNMLESQVLVR